MANLNIIEEIKDQERRLVTPEEMAGKGLLMPLNCSNSGSRKIMHSIQVEHVLDLENPEEPLLQTGFENEFGRHSSSYCVSDSDYEVIYKIGYQDKFYLIVRKCGTNEYDIIERIAYNHITETYGYLYNNKYIDNLKEGDIIKKDDVVKKSTSFSDNNTRRDGVNLISTYISSEYNKEDGIIISKSASKKLRVPLFKNPVATINDNDKPLNIYGDDNEYKSFPDIGEEVKDGILLALRRENKEEALFSQSVNRLKKVMMSDEKFLAEGKVIDIKVYCNNPEILNEMHYAQIKKYYDKQRKFEEGFVRLIKPIIENKCNICSYDLQKKYYNCVKSLNGTEYIKDTVFSNIIIEFVLLHGIDANIGDKISNRYGGKGVISIVLPDEEMPLLDNGEHVEVIFNSSTCVNRENAGQLFESSLNMISNRIMEYAASKVLDVDEALGEYVKFLTILSPHLGNFILDIIKRSNDDEKMMILESCFENKGIIISLLPLSETVGIDTLIRLYEEFDYAQQYKVLTPMKDSMGNIRYIESCRKLTCAYQYIYRLKQYAEEKFSGVSLSATNLKNENSRNSSKKNFKSIYSKTPIKFGEMEMGDLLHIGAETLVEQLMIYSASPHGRRLCEKLLTDDPFDINITLDENSSNRSVEIMNVYLLTIGLELCIEKKRKKLECPISICPITVLPTAPITLYDDNGNVIEPEYDKCKKRLFDAITILNQ